MTDLSATITPKSDQLNADDLTTEPKTIRVTKVTACPGSSEQPIAIFFEGDGGKPFKPCKSMRRVLVQVWGKNGADYVGRSMTLFRDPAVQFGGVAVGGIRISHMSHIDSPMVLVLTASRASRKPYTVAPLLSERQANSKSLEVRAADLVNAIKATKTREKLASVMKLAESLQGEIANAEKSNLLDQITAAHDEHKATLPEAPKKS